MGIITYYVITTTWIFLIKNLVPPLIKIFLWIFIAITMVAIIGTIIYTGSSTFDGKIIGNIFWLCTLVFVAYFFHKTYVRLKRKEILPLLPIPVPIPTPPK
jgi:hypothetical protein